MANQEQPNIDGKEYGQRTIELFQAFQTDLNMPRNRAGYFAQTANSLAVQGELADEVFFKGSPKEIRDIVNEYLDSGEDTGDGSTHINRMLRDGNRDDGE